MQMMTPRTWYREVWEGINNIANDNESALLEDLAVRCGAFLKCPTCRFVTPNDELKCSGCSKPLNTFPNEPEP